MAAIKMVTCCLDPLILPAICKEYTQIILNTSLTLSTIYSCLMPVTDIKIISKIYITNIFAGNSGF